MLTTEQLVAKAPTYLEDALNTECSTHTRSSSAMSAIQCLYLTGVESKSTDYPSVAGKRPADGCVLVDIDIYGAGRHAGVGADGVGIA